MLGKTLGFLILTVLLVSCGETSSQSNTKVHVAENQNQVRNEKKSSELDGNDLSYQMQMKSLIMTALSDEGEKYFFRTESGDCLEKQAEKMMPYYSSPYRLRPSQPVDILPTPNCQNGASFKTSNKEDGFGGKSFMFATAVRVRNKGATNFNDNDWLNMSVEEICEKSKSVGTDGDIGIDGDAPEHWLWVSCM